MTAPCPGAQEAHGEGGQRGPCYRGRTSKANQRRDRPGTGDGRHRPLPPASKLAILRHPGNKGRQRTLGRVDYAPHCEERHVSLAARQAYPVTLLFDSHSTGGKPEAPLRFRARYDVGSSHTRSNAVAQIERRQDTQGLVDQRSIRMEMLPVQRLLLPVRRPVCRYQSTSYHQVSRTLSAS